MPAGPVCLFAQYDPAGRIAPHVLRYLAHLAECGFAVHVACSGTSRLTSDDETALRRIGATPHPRRNAGLDFGAWQDLLRAGCAEGAPEILLANDSVFGPFADLRPLLAAMRARHLDAWGMVASIEGVWHLQSWFVCLSARALASPPVQRVLTQPFAEMTKPEIILRGELGLGTALRAAELACGAAFEEPGSKRLRRLARVNPMHLHWAWLLTSGRVPFVKVELLRDNPIGIPWARRWPAVIARASDYPPELIRRHIGRPTPLPPVPWRTRLLYLLLTRDKGEAIRALAPLLSGVPA